MQGFAQGIGRIFETLGEDSQGFVRLWEMDLQGFTGLWETICEGFARIHETLGEIICNDLQ